MSVVKWIPGQTCMWESTNTPGRFFYGKIMEVHPASIHGCAYAVVRDRNFKQPIHIKIGRLKECSNKTIDFTPRAKPIK